MSTLYIAFSHTAESGQKLGDSVVLAHVARLMAQNEPHDKYILSLSPHHNLNFVFDQFVKDYKVEVVYDDWAPGDLDTIYRNMDLRRAERAINGQHFDTYKELYLRIHGGHRQGQLCGGENGLGRKNIFEYMFFGQETAPMHCFGGTNFGRESLGLYWRPTTPTRSLFLAPHAFSQGNAVFTMEFWRNVIDKLLRERVEITVCSPSEGQFGTHPQLKYSFHPTGLKALFEEIGRQQLVLCGNTGIGWIAAAHGVPIIAGEPKHFWYMDYRYRECGVQSVVNIFGNGSHPGDDSNPPTPANPDEPIRMVLNYLDGR